MIRAFFQQILVAVIRFAAVGIALICFIEVAFCVVGGSDRHVWLPDSYGPVPQQLSDRPVSWAEFMHERTLKSLPVIFIALSGILLFGYSWGILGARLRRFRGARLLSAPFSVCACLPGFWFVVMAAIYSYFQWKRPGFANELFVEQGPDLLSWWHASLVAFPAMVAGIAWQIRSVSGVLEKEVAQSYVKGLFIAGYSDEEIFYRNAFRRSLAPLIALGDRTFPFVFGSLICLEFAFRYPGIGALLVESVKLESYGGILVSSLCMSAILCVFMLIRECAVRLVKNS